jgi:hypothetical protein
MRWRGGYFVFRAAAARGLACVWQAGATRRSRFCMKDENDLKSLRGEPRFTALVGQIIDHPLCVRMLQP